MQLYLKQVLEAFFHTQSSVRHFALNVIALTLNQGLIHPVQVRHEKYFSNTFLTQHWTHRLRPYISHHILNNHYKSVFESVLVYSAVL